MVNPGREKKKLSPKQKMKVVKKELKKFDCWETAKEYFKKNKHMEEEKLKTILYENEGSSTGEQAFQAIKENQKIIEKHFTGKTKVKDTREWEFENILPEDHFISQYLDLAQGLTDAYPEYHFTTALSLISASIDRKIKIRITPTEMYPNFWTLMIGYSTVSRKSTAIAIGKTILGLADMERKTLPEDFSPEALIDYLEEYPQNFFMRDEFGDFLAKMNRTYQSGMDALLSNLYDCPSHYKKKLRKETFEIEDVYMSFLGACVPKQIARHSSVEDLESGFFPRIAFVWPERNKKRKNRRTPTEEETEKQQMLGKWLSGIDSAINQMYQKNDKKEIGFKLSDVALETYNTWCEDYENFILNTEKGKEFSAFFGRISDMVLKISVLVELGSRQMLNTISTISNISKISTISKISSYISDRAGKGTKLTNSTNTHTTDHTNTETFLNGDKNQSNFVITESAIQIGIYYAVKLFLPNARKIMSYVKSYQDEDKIQKVYELAIKYSDSDGKVMHSDLLRYSNMKSSDFQDYIKTMYQSGMIDIDETETGAKYYVPLDPDSNSELPDFNAPSNLNLGVEIPDEINMTEKEINDEGKRLENIKEKTKGKIKELSHTDDGADKSELNNEIESEFDLDEKQRGDLYEMLLREGDVMETDPDHIKVVG